jgi:hypothetical protein
MDNHFVVFHIHPVGGRAPQPPKERRKRGAFVANRKRPYQVICRLSEDELLRFTEILKLSELKQTEYVRKAILKQKIIVVPDLRQTLIELKRQGVNLNQIAHQLNEGNRVEAAEIAIIKENLNALYLQLLQLNERINR